MDQITLHQESGLPPGAPNGFAMEQNRFAVEIVTPEGSRLKTTAELVEFPSGLGEMGVLPGHVPLLTVLDVGELRVFHGGKVDRFAVAGGYVQVRPYAVQIVATFASTGDEEAIENACQRAKFALETVAAENPATIEAELVVLRSDLCRLQQIRTKKRRS